jgi:NADPH-dependent 2,4-dienoyl-CoA reductase/sulfur reductase-like enzyme
MPQSYDYIIVGAGLAGASAIEGIREVDPNGSILLMGDEAHLPYNRPPLSKDLWLGKEQVDGIFAHDEQFYTDNRVDFRLGARAEEIDPGVSLVIDEEKETFNFGKLLLATGGSPRTLDIPGGDFEAICYYRTLDDYNQVKAMTGSGKSATVIGGGFIGSEIAAALNQNGVDVTMIFPGQGLCRRVFPESLSLAVAAMFAEKGIRIVTDTPAAFERDGDKYATVTKGGARVEADIVIVGVGILPDVELAAEAGLRVDNGIVVNERLQTSHPGIYAAGDNANFPFAALGKQTRVEHWDNARKQGKLAGKNMAGGEEAYTYIPYFFSDLFDLGYEAVGDVDSSLETFPVWQDENRTGIVYYLRDRKVRGAMMCNVWKKLKAARELIQSDAIMSDDDLRAALA